MNPTIPAVILCATCRDVVLDMTTREAQRHLAQGGRLGHLVDAEGAPICGLCLEAQAAAESAAIVERAKGRQFVRALNALTLPDEP